MRRNAPHHSNKPVTPIVQFLRARRVDLGMSVYHLAEKIGYSPSSVTSVENGNHNPSLYMVQNIANALGLEVTLCELSELIKSTSQLSTTSTVPAATTA